jgi:hypothetical protein
MTKHVLSRRAAFVAGGLAVYLKPKLATDAKIDLNDILKGLSAKNYKTESPKVAAAITKALDGKLAKDASLADIGKVMDEMAEPDVKEGADANPDSGLPMSAEELKKQTMDAEETEEEKAARLKKEATDADPGAAIETMLKGKVDDATLAQVLAMVRGETPAMDAEETEEEKAARMKKEATDADPDKKPEVTKAAMDKAIKLATDKAIKDTIATQNSISEAREAVQPYVGKLAMSFDSAEGVYRAALATMPGVLADEVKELPLAALKTVLRHQDHPGKERGSKSLAMDAAGADSYSKMFPDASRIIRG